MSGICALGDGYVYVGLGKVLVDLLTAAIWHYPCRKEHFDVYQKATNSHFYFSFSWHVWQWHIVCSSGKRDFKCWLESRFVETRECLSGVCGLHLCCRNISETEFTSHEICIVWHFVTLYPALLAFDIELYVIYIMFRNIHTILYQCVFRSTI